MLLHHGVTSMGSLGGFVQRFSCHPAVCTLFWYHSTRQTQVDIKPGWHWSLLGVRWSWVAYTQEAGTLDRWEEKGALERYKWQWREGYTWGAWSSSPQLWCNNLNLTYEHTWIEFHQHLCSRPVTLRIKIWATTQVHCSALYCNDWVRFNFSNMTTN